MKFIIHVNTLLTNDLEQILLVREKKEPVYNKFNLPGGHLEPGEELTAGAKREAMEEINSHIEIKGLIGIYTGCGKDHYINFIFAGKITGGEPFANKDEINDLGWYSVEEIMNFPEELVLNPAKLKKIITDYQSGRMYSLEIIEEKIYS
jgi:ADP-ribose pyrophosphatase YjhB (NUDIX family)